VRKARGLDRAGQIGGGGSKLRLRSEQSSDLQHLGGRDRKFAFFLRALGSHGGLHRKAAGSGWHS
jgi:hypothetical protein